MIQIVYHRKFHRLTMEGHAGSADHGKDLVCASASILAYTLAKNVLKLAAGGQIRMSPVVKMEEGRTEICVTPRSGFQSVVTLIFDSLCIGFALLANDYPENVSYEIRE